MYKYLILLLDLVSTELVTYAMTSIVTTGGSVWTATFIIHAAVGSIDISVDNLNTSISTGSPVFTGNAAITGL